MFLPECASLASQHQELASTIERVDAQLQQMRTAEVIRLDDFAGFVDADPNRLQAVFELLVAAGVLVGELMLECRHCRMVVLRSDYDDALEEDGECRCSSCDRALSLHDVCELRTYRRGEAWNIEAVPPNDVAIPEPDNVFLREGQKWKIVFGGDRAFADHYKGMTHIAFLLGSPGKDFTPIEVQAGSLGPKGLATALGGDKVLDEEAMDDIRKEVEYLQAEIAKAEDIKDIGRAEKLQTDMQKILSEAGAATGLGGKARTLGDQMEKARKAVSMAIGRAIKGIERVHAPLAQHFDQFLTTGNPMSYKPVPHVIWGL